MRIAQVAPYFYPHVGGVESHVLTLSGRLLRNGHEVTVFTSKHADLREKDLFQGINIIRSKQVANIFSTPITPSLKKTLAKEDFDVVHAHTPPPLTSYYAAKACKKKKIPFVVTYHCDLELPRITGKIATAIYQRTLGRYTFNHADRIVVHTRTYGATSRTIWNSEVAIVPSAVNPIRFKEAVDFSDITARHRLEGKRMVLFVGRLVYHKGVDYLIDSAKLTPEDVRFIIVGSGDYLGKLKKRAREKNVEDKVIFTGNVSFNDIPKYFAACDIFVLPSISRLEAFGLVVLEAMASGKPVIVSTIPGVMELVTDDINGLHTEPMNSEDLANKINYLLSNPVIRKVMGENGRKKVENEYTWDKVVREIEEIYGGVIQK
ncbi:MAG: glycosyltransferase family 4 protein [Methanomassiliicoccales archaeon]|nr:MAG: glycosyltransferase family 4 protein [Methanomassiliicoccales archaeon]